LHNDYNVSLLQATLGIKYFTLFYSKDNGCLTPLYLTLFQLYRGGQFSLFVGEAGEFGGRNYRVDTSH